MQNGINIDMVELCEKLHKSGFDTINYNPELRYIDIPLDEVNKITIEPRPPYCNRGRYQVNPYTSIGIYHIDHSDGFPRYYFDKDAMILETKSWVEERKKAQTP